jgi:intraflagellar transport protein 57
MSISAASPLHLSPKFLSHSLFFLSHITQGPLYILWENSLEKLKILNYEQEYCQQYGRKVFNRIHFIFTGKNTSTQFDEFMDLSSWLCYKCSGDLDLFKRDPYDDPTTVANKLMLALRSLDCRLSFPAQKLRTPYGENVCNVLDFLTDKALAVQTFRWNQPRYADADIVCLLSLPPPPPPYLPL